MRLRIVGTILTIAVILIVIKLMRFNFTALPVPGALETRIANQAKALFITRASRQGIPPPPQDKQTSVEVGNAEYDMNCSVCHATDGRSKGTPGQWMYPRASDLTSKRVQNYSDQELYWIIQNGIRYTGMPAFGRVETPNHIWGLVNYVRSLSSDSGNGNSTSNGDGTSILVYPPLVSELNDSDTTKRLCLGANNQHRSLLGESRTRQGGQGSPTCGKNRAAKLTTSKPIPLSLLITTCFCFP